MTRYLVRQTIWSFIKLFIFISFMFFFVQIMMPGDFVDQFSLGCDAICREEMRIQLGLNLPIWQRYLKWLGEVFTLNFGSSLSGMRIIDILEIVVPPTLLVFVTGTIVAFIIGMWLGKVTAWGRWGITSQLATLGGLTLFTSFPPWLTFLVTYALGRRADYVVMGERGGLGTAHFIGLTRETWANVLTSPSTIILHMMFYALLTGIFFFSIKALIEQITKQKLPGAVFLVLTLIWSVVVWEWRGIDLLAFDILRLAFLPLLTYILLSFGETMLIMQVSVQESMKSKYIETARAKGLPESVVRDRHAVRNALIPVLSRLVISLPYLITGVVIIESSLGWPGMGTSMWNALYWQNMPVVMNTLLIVGVLSLIARLILDVISAYLDPRIRFKDHKGLIR
jgi:peptide/nickel transport system permease protein